MATVAPLKESSSLEVGPGSFEANKPVSATSPVALPSGPGGDPEPSKNYEPHGVLSRSFIGVRNLIYQILNSAQDVGSGSEQGSLAQAPPSARHRLEDVEVRLRVWSDDIIEAHGGGPVSISDVLDVLGEEKTSTSIKLGEILADMWRALSAWQLGNQEQNDALHILEASVSELQQRKYDIQDETFRILEAQEKEKTTSKSELLAPSVLCFDGGGVRSISSILILEALMDEVRKQLSDSTPDIQGQNTTYVISRVCSNGRRDVEPYNFFNYMFGSSSGGLLAIMLGRLQMTLTECEAQYEQSCGDIFGHPRLSYRLSGGLMGTRFNQKNLIKATRFIVSKFDRSKEGETSRNPLFASPDSPCRVGVVAAKSVSGEDGSTIPYIFRTYNVPTPPGNSPVWTRRGDWDSGGASGALVWEVARATAAAPTFFSAISIDGHEFLDAGFLENNPTHEAFYEIADLHSERPKGACFISIGTGTPRRRGANLPRRGAFKLLTTVLSFLTTASSRVDEAMVRHAKENDMQYFRFQGPPLELEPGEWRVRRRANGKRSHTRIFIREMTEAYLSENAVHQKLNECAEALVSHWRARTQAQRREKILDSLKRRPEPPPVTNGPSYDERLFLAVKEGTLEDAAFLLKRGGDPNWKNELHQGQTALFCAVMNGDKAMEELLLQNGADPEVLDNSGRTALSYTKEQGQDDVGAV